MGGRGKFDKSRRRGNLPSAKPGDLDQFGKDVAEGKRMAKAPHTDVDNERGG